MIGAPPLKNLSLPFLRRALAFELQCAALGGPKARVIEDLERIADGKPAHTSVGARPQPGARLVREWQGRSRTVEVVESGFPMVVKGMPPSPLSPGRSPAQAGPDLGSLD